MKTRFLYASICTASGLLFVNLYTSLVDVHAWGSNIPDSISIAREYFKTVNPGNFFRIFSPFNQLLAIIVLILFWKSVPNVKLYLALSLVMYIIGEGMTFGYFYPRNDILFHTASLTDIELLKKTWSEWQTMNWVRTGVLFLGVLSSLKALQKLQQNI
jgi:uncharacterized membrane protein